MTGNTYQITPFMHVADLDATVRFLEDILGFVTEFREGNYAYVVREGAAIRILSHGEPEELGVAHHGFAYYIDVRDLDQVLAEIGDKIATLPKGDVHGPVDQPYRQRELMIRVPDGNLLVFGQAIST